MYMYARVGMYVVSHAKSTPKFTDIGDETDPNRPPNRPKILPKLVPGRDGSLQAVPSAPQERQESSQELPQECPEASQVRLGVLKRSLKRVPRHPETAKNCSQVTLGSQEGDIARSSFALHA